MKTMRPFLQSTDRNWHEIAEITLYTLIGWEVILFLLFLLIAFGYDAQRGLPTTWLLGGMLQVWALKKTLPQFSNKQALLTLVGWGLIPFLLLVFDQILGWSVDYSPFLTAVSCLVGQILQFWIIKRVVILISIRSLFLTSLGWFIACVLWFMAIQSKQMLIESFGFIGGMVMGGIGGGIISYILFPFQAPRDNQKISFYHRYFKIRVLVGIILLHWILIIIVPPPSHPIGVHKVRMKSVYLGLEMALDMYRLDYWQYPTTEQGLKALVNKPVEEEMLKRWQGPYCKKKALKDPWGNDFQYKSDGKNYEIISFGPDAHAGGDDDTKVTYLDNTSNE